MLALLDIFQKLDGRGESFLHIVADIAVGGVTRKQAAIDRTQPELRQIVFIQENLPVIVHLAEINIRFDQARLRLVVAQAGTRVQLADHIHRALDEFIRTIERARDFLELVALQKLPER